MAVDMSGVNVYPYFDRITLSGTAPNATEIVLPNGPLLFSVRPITNEGRIASSGSDGGPLSDDYLTVAADTTLQVQVSLRTDRTPVMYVASGTASTVVEIVLERPA